MPSGARRLSDAGYVAALFEAMDAAGLTYAVLHGAGDIPDAVSSDIDIVVPEGSLSRLTRFLATFAEEQAGVLCQVIRHETTARYHVLALPGDLGRPTFLKIDASTDFRRDGRILFTSTELLTGVRRVGNVVAVSVGVEFAAYLSKRIMKGVIEPEHTSNLANLMTEDALACLGAWRELMGTESADELAGILGSGWERARADRLLGQRRALLHRTFVRHPLRTLGYAASRPLCLLGRISRRTGFQVAVLGPDGIGKSTLLTGLALGLEPTVRHVEVLHLRPRLLPGRSSPVGGSVVPYRTSAFGWPGSVLKLAYLILDYNLGYWTRIWPLLVRSTLVLCDRYYLDVVADPLRYRYAGPRWLPRVADSLVAGPDAYIVLSAATDAVQARKAEVASSVTEVQAEAYRLLTVQFPDTSCVDASGSAETVLNDVAWTVLRKMAKRSVNRP